jgi:hypothetical protein
MKKYLIPLLLVASLLLGGCDFFRALSGRPTSSELETKRLEITRMEEQRHQALIDSMMRVEQWMADSLAALEEHLLDSLTQRKGTLLNPTKLGGLYTTRLETRYCIVVGAFRNRSFAEKKLVKCNEAGYPATIVSFRNGYNSVAICPSDTLSVTLDRLRKLRGTSICPQDSWILVNE